MARIISYLWFYMVMRITGLLPDLQGVMRLRGWLLRPSFRSCGRNFQVCSGAMVVYSSNVSVGDDVYIAYGCWIQGIGDVVLEDQVMLGPYTVLASSNHSCLNGSYRFAPGRHAPIRLGRGSWTGSHVVITAGVSVGKGARCAAGAIVTRDVPDGGLVGGVPAKPLSEKGQMSPQFQRDGLPPPDGVDVSRPG